MEVVDSGHEYILDSLDGEQVNRLVFVKREGEKYPGNVGSHPGTTIQEVLRALIERGEYVNRQTPSEHTRYAIRYLKWSLYRLEVRAAERHGRTVNFTIEEAVAGLNKCQMCGHMGCAAECRQHNEEAS